MRSPMCSNCGGPAILGELSLEEQQLRVENARLKDELDRVCALAGKFLGKPIAALAATFPSGLPNSSLELAVRGGNEFGGFAPNLPAISDFITGVSSPLRSVIPPSSRSMSSFGGVDRSIEKSVLLELALTAMDELVKMTQIGEPLWIPGYDGVKETLNYDEYLQAFPRCIGMRPVQFVSEATRETGMVIINSLALVETLMDAVSTSKLLLRCYNFKFYFWRFQFASFQSRWADMFPGMIARAATTDIICSGVGGTRNGALQLVSFIASTCLNFSIALKV